MVVVVKWKKCCNGQLEPSLSLQSVAQQKNGAAKAKKGFEEEEENEEGAGRGCGEVKDGEGGGGQGEDATHQLDCDQVQLV